MNKKQKKKLARLVVPIAALLVCLVYPMTGFATNYATSTETAPGDAVNFNLQEATNFVVEKGTTVPAGATQGRLYFNTKTATPDGNRNTLYVDMGTQLYHLGREARNVKAFGAKGDGSTQDLTAIQAALDDLGDTGGIVFFPPGEYRINSTLYIPDDKQVILEGSGNASIIRALTGFTGSAIVANEGSGTIGPVIRNLAVIGYGSLSDLDGISLSDVKGAMLHNLQVIMHGSSGSDAIQFTGVERSEIRSIHIEGPSEAAIHLDTGTSGCLVSNVHASDAGDALGYGLKLVGATNCMLEVIQASDCDDYGVYMEDTVRCTLMNVAPGGSPASGLWYLKGDQYSCFIACTYDYTAGTALTITDTSVGSYFSTGMVSGDINIASTSKLLKFDQVREEDSVDITDNATDTYWNAIVDDSSHSNTARRSPHFARVYYDIQTTLYSGPGTPEGNVAAVMGSLYLRTDGDTTTTLYVKETVSGDTGWAAK